MKQLVWVQIIEEENITLNSDKKVFVRTDQEQTESEV